MINYDSLMRSSPGHTPLECQIKLIMNSHFLWIYEILNFDKVSPDTLQQIGIFTCQVITPTLVSPRHDSDTNPQPH